VGIECVVGIEVDDVSVWWKDNWSVCLNFVLWEELRCVLMKINKGDIENEMELDDDK